MFLWFVGCSFLATWAVFQSPAVDYRLVMLGALIPLADVVFGEPTVLHSLLGSGLCLATVMIGARGRRLVQRRLVGIPIGMMLHLFLDGTWARSKELWWPLMGADLGGVAPAVTQRPAWMLVAMEAAGVASLVWCWRRFGFSEAKVRARFLKEGHLDRAMVQGSDRGVGQC